jgi:hypothetical protein
MRRRDPAFANAGRYKERHRKEQRRRSGSTEQKWYTPADFLYDESKQTCICPAGHRLYRSGVDIVTGGYRGAHFKAPKSACRSCELRQKCLRYPERTVQRQVVFFKEREAGGRRKSEAPLAVIEAMKRKVDSLVGRWIYGRRIATVEPVFANIQNKGMRRFTLRGRGKVNVQWKLYTLVHNVEKIANFAAA